MIDEAQLAEWEALAKGAADIGLPSVAFSTTNFPALIADLRSARAENERLRAALEETLPVLNELSNWFVGQPGHDVRIGVAAESARRKTRAALGDHPD
jgi:hypothetical protein